MRKWLVLGLLVLLSFSYISAERYVVQVDDMGLLSEDLQSKIIDEIEVSDFGRQKAGVRVGVGEKDLVVLDVDEEEVMELKKYGLVEQDYKVSALGNEELWNYDYVGLDVSNLTETYGEGVKIAVFDTGVDFGLLDIESGYDFVNNDADASDDNGHGTFVAQIMKNPSGYPLGSEIYSVKVLDENGDGFVSGVYNAVVWAYANDIDIVVMSFGGEGDSQILNEIMSQAYAGGILFLAASGNTGDDRVFYPASYDSVVSVGSMNKELGRSSFSTYGSSVEFVAPGEKILLTDGVNQYLVDGTSFSTPHAAVVAASYWGKDLGLSNSEVRDIMRENVIDLGVVGKDDEFGWGMSYFNRSLYEEDNGDEYPEFFSGVINSRMEIMGAENQERAKIIEFEDRRKLAENLNKTIEETDFRYLQLTNNDYYLFYDNTLEWVSHNNLIQLKFESEINEDIFKDYLDLYPSDLGELEKFALHINQLEEQSFTKFAGDCSDCGRGLLDNCESHECYALSSTCYLTIPECTGWGDCICLDGIGLSNGDGAYCNYKSQRTQGCFLGEYDCDSDGQCSTNLDCVMQGSSTCIWGSECGCCQEGQYWNSNSNSCYWPQSIDSVSWSVNQANTGDTVQLRVYASGFSDGQPVTIEIIEDDIISSICSGNSITTINTQIDNNFVSENWIVANGNDGIGNLEYCFKVTINSQTLVSDNLDTKFGHNGWDCDQSDEISGGQCSPNLVCDGNTPFFDTESEGCCYLEENWNNQNKLCNDAVKGKIYQVTQNGQTFNDAPYGNLKLRVFIAEDDYLFFDKDNIVKSFDLFSDSQGNFAFNPEREISNWNWDLGFLAKYYIHSIYVIEGNEVIGKWTNQFSDDPKYQNAVESVNQIIRIHKDKNTWRKVQEFPEIDPLSGLSLSAQSLTEQSANIEKPVHIDWRGKLNISRPGEYSFLFNVTGNVKLKINDKEIINSEKNGIKEGKINLDYLENNVSFEFFESGNRNPKVYWKYGREEFGEVTEENLLRESTKTILVDELDTLSSLSFSETNNQPDYMISFLESPEKIRGQKPLVLVHGKHGGSGYWDKDEAQNWFNDNGYDAWEFYYPGDDYIDKSGALLGDALDHLKKDYYNQNQKFDIVAHSMGGLVSRSYVQDTSPYLYKEDVNHLVMIGTPNYGSSGATGIVEDWQFGFFDTIFSSIICFGPISNYRDFEENCWIRGYNPEDPIYQQMSFGSELIENLSRNKSQSIKKLVISGDENKCFKIGGVYIDDNSILMESDNGEDCLVSHSASSLLNEETKVSIISGKSHITEITEIQDYAQLIQDFLEDKSDSTLAYRSYSYYNPQTGYNKNFFNRYNEGSIQIKLMENNQIWNENSNENLQIQKLDVPYQGYIFDLQRNKQSKNYFHFNRNGGDVDSYYTLPEGDYKLIVPGYIETQDMYFEIKPMETNFLEIDLKQQEVIGNSSSGIDDDAIMGDVNAPVTMLLFCDYQGPFCERLVSDTLPLIKENYIETGKVKFAFRDFPLRSIHPQAQLAAEAAECVGEYDDEAYYEMFDILYENQQSLNISNYKMWASGLGYNIDNCLDNNQMSSEVNQDYADAGAYGARGTPYSVIISPNGTEEPISGAVPYANFEFVFNQFLEVDEEKSIMTIISPKPQVYTDRRINFDIDLSETVDEITYVDNADDRSRERTICRRGCYGYDRSRGFRDGFHNVSFIAYDEGGNVVDEKNVEFMVDSRDPRIGRSEPRRGFADGWFSVEITEDNLEEVKLFYGDDSVNLDIGGDCYEDRRRMKCETEVDLSEYDGEEIEYWFEVVDVSGNKDVSRESNVDVDTTDPVITSFDYEVDRRRIEFEIGVDEENFDEITYLDLNDDRGRERRLCSRMRDGVCSGRAIVRDENINWMIYVRDEAGNEVMREFVL